MALKIGSIVEIATKNGLGYAQYTHKHKEYGELIRVIPGFYKSRPQNLDLLVNHPTQFATFFPLGVAIRRKIFPTIGVCPVPEFAEKFPIFKTGHYDETVGKITVWFLWDGEKDWRVSELTDEQKNYPMRGIINVAALIDHIEKGWTPRDRC